MRVSYLDTVNKTGKGQARPKMTVGRIEHQVVLVDGEGTDIKLNKVIDIDTDFRELNNGLSLLKDTGERYKIFFDQSTNTGYSIFQGSELRVIGRLGIGRKGSLESYKNRLELVVNNYLQELDVEEVWYEEVYDKENMRTTEVLMYIKHLFKDINYSNKIKGKDIGVYGVDHTKWKSVLSDKGIKGDKNNKEQVREYVFSILNLGNSLDSLINEDMSDALGMGIARSIKSSDKSFYMMARFEKNLPVHESIIISNDVDFKTVKMRKPFREARELGIIVYESEDGKLPIKPHELSKRVLSHTDKLVAIEIPRNYREYGVLLITNNIKYEDFKNEEDKMYMLFARKRRL